MDYFIDTNIFLRTLINSDSEVHEECKRFLELIKTNKISGLTSDIVITEVVWTLKSFYKINKEEIIKSVASIYNLRGIKYVNNFDRLLGIEMYSKANVKYVDALIASIPGVMSKEIIIVSYDKDFDKLDINRKEPSHIIQEYK